mmetsp:Transcript_15769/g.22523  ORF Transcript_15769/g.22523 Transcript_15769/m.22523 type:complete len:781 (+) Transcript_15769:23-2365(+)
MDRPSDENKHSDGGGSLLEEASLKNCGLNQAASVKQTSKPMQLNRRESRRKHRIDVAPPESSNEKIPTSSLSGEADVTCSGSLQNKLQLSKSKSKQSKKNKLKTKRKNLWRHFVPPGTIDPISLDSIVSLAYPPFAIAAEHPWHVVPIWPTSVTRPVKETLDQSEVDQSMKREHVNLYDGRVLAYYLVSQLTFIDPLNRRDLTRAELVNLDQYLRRHKLGKAHVVEAYDNLGMTKSRAGAAGHTSQGRAELLQLEAQSVLEALFASAYRHSRMDEGRQTQRQFSHCNNDATALEVDQFRAEFEQLYLGRQHTQSRCAPDITLAHAGQPNGNGILDYEEGYVIMDDDENPGLRGRSYGDVMSRQPVALFSPTNQEAHPEQVSDPFPPLSRVFTEKATASFTSASSQKPLVKAPSRSLKSISTMIKPSNPKDLERQRKATEDARLLAETSPFSCITQLRSQTSEAMLDRNQRLANALGVMPSTLRHNHLQRTGWSRPTMYDEFANELNLTNYPLPLLFLAKEHFEFIVKLERRWIKFLEDDKSSSLSLRPMAKPRRKIVHEYSEFWKLQSESFDPEPKRYIHSVKLRDTQAPYLLLSDAVKRYRGSWSSTVTNPIGAPVPLVKSTTSSVSRDCSTECATDATAPLLPRYNVSVSQVTSFDYDDVTDIRRLNQPPILPLSVTAKASCPIQPLSRFSSLDRERRKLYLAPRTLPLESLAFRDEGPKVIQAHRNEKQKLQEVKKMAILAKAFESESDPSETSSDWEVGEAEYHSSSDEYSHLKSS